MAKEPRSTSRCFVVSGRFITDHARDRVFDFGWEDGIRFLSETIPEVDYKLAVEILAGRQRFAGDSSEGIGVAEEEKEIQEEIAGRYRQTYAGIWYDRITKLRFKPYAYVTSFNADDVREGRTPNRYTPKPHAAYVDLPHASNAMRDYALFRCVAYMDDPVEDRVALIQVPGIGTQATLWKEFKGTVPLWWKQLNSPELAIVEWVREFGLPQERGASPSLRGPKPRQTGTAWNVELPKGPTLSASFATPPGPPVPDRPDEKRQDFVRSFLPAGTPDDVADGLARALAGDSEDYPVPEPTKDLVGTKWAWMDNRGKIYPCRGYMDHIPLAHAIVAEFDLSMPGLGSNAERVLELSGWVKLGTSAQGKCHAYVEEGKRTSVQRDAVFEWLVAQGAGADQIKRWVEQGDGYDYDF